MSLSLRYNVIMEPKKYSSVVKWSLIIGIVIVINLFLNYAISLVYSSPDYNNYCKQEQVIEPVDNKETCVDKGGQWNGNDLGRMISSPDGVTVPKSLGYCDLQFTCRNDYEAASKIYNRNIFIALVVLGVILVALSFALAFNTILSVSFSMGGILSIIIASMRYWSDADNLVRVLILFFALVALIYFAVRKFKN